jgi:signal transduction histidine kinase
VATAILERGDDHLGAIIEDDGGGFDHDAVMASEGAENRPGLRGIRERVAAVGGELQVETGPGRGTPAGSRSTPRRWRLTRPARSRSSG